MDEHITRFEDLRAWERARELTNRIYEASNGQAFSRDFAMRDQIRSAALSVMSNIAEGFDRNRNSEFLYFLRVAKASCGEVRSQLYCAFDQGYIDEATVQSLMALTAKTSGVIRNLQRSLERIADGTRHAAPGT